MICPVAQSWWIAADAVVGRHPDGVPLYKRPHGEVSASYPWYPEMKNRIIRPAILPPTNLKSPTLAVIESRSKVPALMAKDIDTPKLFTAAHFSMVSPALSDTSTLIARDEHQRYLMPSTRNNACPILSPTPRKAHKEGVSHLWSPEPSPGPIESDPPTSAPPSPSSRPPSSPPKEPLPPVPVAAPRTRSKSESKRRIPMLESRVRRVNKENNGMF